MRACKLLVVLGALSGLATAAGCATMQETSAGLVGCQPDEVKITRDVGFGLNRTWQVDCRGRTFECSGAREERDRCQEVTDPAAAPRPEEAKPAEAAPAEPAAEPAKAEEPAAPSQP
jgi:hypothetical protein